MKLNFQRWIGAALKAVNRWYVRQNPNNAGILVYGIYDATGEYLAQRIGQAFPETVAVRLVDETGETMSQYSTRAAAMVLHGRNKTGIEFLIEWLEPSMDENCRLEPVEGVGLTEWRSELYATLATRLPLQSILSQRGERLPDFYAVRDYLEDSHTLYDEPEMLISPKKSGVETEPQGDCLES